ncbi:MAG: lytic transglycosylase domain-containing protein [Chloroflexi bacterium]|nr:lytic transglycosylase domain-containing protein [Chloroflexota bacterium]MCI0575957.1 lytic transglycosylase domain-containing protein [Chloroflexota bacterium]MCI0649397.1 lytic transglycosylase domain-containing protein [Chloroflexota bacterium]MCI0727078.1 lytic transglycosylase domain-containing protein [Chloroflexota bacterium]
MTYYDEHIGYYSIATPFTPGDEVEAGPGYGYVMAQPSARPGSPHQRMAFVLAVVVVVAVLLASLRPRGQAMAAGQPAQAAAAANGGQPEAALGAAPAGSGVLSPVFTPEVRHWEAQIVAWSQAHGLDPDIAATIMQIESCGDPQAVSRSGAQGLFQVMPFHFTAGENSLDPDTNARRGLGYFTERLEQTSGDIGQAFAGYNGGHVAAAGNWESWASETQRYYTWSTGIYQEAKDGLTTSPTLQRWLEAGGVSLCRQAAGRLGL